MNGGAVTLDDIEAAYRRASRALDRALEDAYEFVADEIFSELERDEFILDAAFFVLIFGQLERRVNELAMNRLNRSEERNALRDRPFDRRLREALPDDTHAGLRTEIGGWYRLRNRAAHGELVASGFNIPPVIQRARDLDRLLSR